MSILKPAILVFSMAILTGCNNYNIKYDYDTQANYAAFKTFDWYAASVRARGKANNVENPLMDRRVRGAVERELVAKGFQLQKTAEPDFLVTYYPVYRNRAYHTSTTVGVGWGRRPFGYGVATRFHELHQFQEGSIVLEIVDNKTNQLIWQGAATGALTGLEDPQDADEQVAKAVHSLLEQFPPQRGR